MTQTKKIEAFLIHLLISLFIFLTIYFSLKFLFYPSPLFDMDGGKQGLKIIAFVDVVLGPLLTLIIYKKGKPGLKRDLSIIGILQLACLVAGSFIAINERPLALILSYDGFHSMNKSSLAIYAQKEDFFDKWPGRTPKYLYVELPQDKAESLNLKLSQLSDGPLYIRENLLHEFDNGHFEPTKYSINLTTILNQNPNHIEQILDRDKKLKSLGINFIYVELIAKYGACHVIFDLGKHKILEPLIADKCKG